MESDSITFSDTDRCCELPDHLNQGQRLTLHEKGACTQPTIKRG